jgi:hypothetical protein
VRNRSLPIVAASVLIGCAATSPTPRSQSQTDDGDGFSCQQRIKVSAIQDEYAWVKAHYPGSKVTKQALLTCSGSPTDKLTVRTAEARELEIFFDISSFF